MCALLDGMAVGCKGVEMDCTPVDIYSTRVGVCIVVDIRLHACGRLQYGLASQGLIFSLFLLLVATCTTVHSGRGAHPQLKVRLSGVSPHLHCRRQGTACEGALQARLWVRRWLRKD